jgi:hypothetical protein
MSVPGAITSMLGSQSASQGSNTGDRTEPLIAVPADLFSGLLQRLGGQVMDFAGPPVGVLPFSTVPSGAGPQGKANGPGGGQDLIAVPAGLWGSLIGTLSGVAGGLIGGQTGQTISNIGQTVGNVLPFSTIPSGAAA